MTEPTLDKRDDINESDQLNNRIDSPIEKSEQSDIKQPKKYMRRLAITSISLALFGFVLSVLPSLGTTLVSGDNDVVSSIFSIFPTLVLISELLAMLIGIVVVIKLPKGSNARGIAFTGIYISCAMLFLTMALGMFASIFLQ